MKKSVFFIAVFIVLSGCQVPKYLSVLNGSKSDGTLTMSFDYGGFQKPVVQWKDANERADNYCKQWGYSGHQWFDPQTTVLYVNGYGQPIGWRVIYKCQCTQ